MVFIKFKSKLMFDELTMPGLSLLNPIKSRHSNIKIKAKTFTNLTFSFLVSSKYKNSKLLKMSALENQIKFILLKIPRAKIMGNK